MTRKEEKLYTVSEVAKVFGKTRQTIRNWFRAGKLNPKTYRVMYGANGTILDLRFTEHIFDWMNPEKEKIENLAKTKNKKASKMLKKIVE